MKVFVSLCISIIFVILLLNNNAFSIYLTPIKKSPIYAIFRPNDLLKFESLPQEINWYGIESTDSVYYNYNFLDRKHAVDKLIPKYVITKINIYFKPSANYYYKAEILNKEKYLFIIGINDVLNTGAFIFDEGPFTIRCKEMDLGYHVLFSPPGDTVVSVAAFGKMAIDTSGDVNIDNSFIIEDYTILYIKQEKKYFNSVHQLNERAFSETICLEIKYH